ncbi:hypothetical protein B0J17DRAFT_709644 [Rhizoctonia solani]|nr:hypothetical protein B0J17DRAFT_709644 [Rhizoctonia solani]
MTHIFHLVLVQPCDLHRVSSYQAGQLRYLDYLAHVCALWRHIAISCSSLWRHIDVSPYGPGSSRLLARAAVYSERAGRVPIELHISDKEHNSLEGPPYPYKEIYQFLSHMADCMETLEFVMTREFGGFQRNALSRLLLGQRPTLRKLFVLSERDDFDTFIVDNDFIPGVLERRSKHLPLGLKKEHLESRFAPLTTLHLQGIFPLWSSTAYQRLVDLRLLSTSRRSHITEAKFIAILKSSPELQILHFGLDIQETTPDTEQITPVDLQDLRVVKIFPFTNRNENTLSPSSVLRLLAPGTKSLWLSFNDFYESDSIEELENFFARSRVTRFYARFAFPPLSIFLQHAVQLECVVFDRFIPGDYHEHSPHGYHWTERPQYQA